MKPVKNTTILYMDDDQDDIELLKEALCQLDPSFHLLHASNGEEGLQKLGALKESNALPCLIVLDVNMPRLCGRKTFEKIKADANLDHIPVVIFSTSDNEKDRAHFAGKSVEYMTKPVQFSLFVEAAKRLLNFCQN